MFVDVKPRRNGPKVSIVLSAMGAKPHKISTGVYAGCAFNFSNLFDVSDLDEFYDDEKAGVPNYGVADSIVQFLEKYGEVVEASPYGFAVGFTEVHRGEQPEGGGWRWHKWGPYIGTKRPQHEYLYNETDIESVVTFSVLKTKEIVR